MSRVETPQDADPNSTASYGGAARMAGDNSEQPQSGPDGSPAGSGDPQQALANAVQIIRKAEQSIVDLSQQFPQASQEVRRARDGLRAVLKKIVSTPGGSEPSVPRTAY